MICTIVHQSNPNQQVISMIVFLSLLTYPRPLVTKEVFTVFGKDCRITSNADDINQLVFGLLPSVIPFQHNVKELKSISEAVSQSFLCSIHPFLMGISNALNTIGECIKCLLYQIFLYKLMNSFKIIS